MNLIHYSIIVITIPLFYSFAPNNSNNGGKFFIINELIIELEEHSNITSFYEIGETNLPLHVFFFHYFIENAGNQKRSFPEYTEKKIIFRQIHIPKHSSFNVTSEIENYGMEIVRELTKREFFNSIDYHVENQTTLKIFIK